MTGSPDVSATALTGIRRTRVRVRYAETDQMGVVYYANYLVWFEVARAEWLRQGGWSYREMEHDGMALPVIEAHCEYRHPARYDDEIEIAARGTLLTPVRVRFDYNVVRVADDIRRGGRPYSPRRGGRRRQAVPLATTRTRDVAMKASSPAPPDSSARISASVSCSMAPTVIGLDCFTDYYPRERKERNLASLRGSARFTLVEASLADADLEALLDGVTHVFHLAAQAGVRKSWGQRFSRLYRQQRGGDPDLARGLRRTADRASRLCLELVRVWRRSAAADA